MIYVKWNVESKWWIRKKKRNFPGVKPKTELGKNIVSLWMKGWKKSEIVKQLNCSYYSVNYYCTKGYKEKRQIKKREYRSTWVGKLLTHWDGFKRSRQIKSQQKYSVIKDEYEYKVLLNHLGGIQTNCYLTGEPINLETDAYQLDHIVPLSKGGTSEITNCGITIPVANQMKTDMTVSELLDMCEKILVHYNYTVTKPST